MKKATLTNTTMTKTTTTTKSTTTNDSDNENEVNDKENNGNNDKDSNSNNDGSKNKIDNDDNNELSAQESYNTKMLHRNDLKTINVADNSNIYYIEASGSRRIIKSKNVLKVLETSTGIVFAVIENEVVRALADGPTKPVIIWPNGSSRPLVKILEEKAGLQFDKKLEIKM
ncbi:biogenesis of lysosome-related organelles complex 1 subunit 2-like [Belonocnema kinseyi]|uniref:biogenesis of lysosome-related organelles complex 1 subunit 2-like n=1 Tax=Belonocnema kinseyi TaxID=2817044 RepID=UPI00143DDDAA|nr:biogenesis of lysosome-related organelles complex 1 subunit 2-like [Belonocnema kinseyi]